MAKYIQAGKTVHFRLKVTLNSSTVSGVIGFTPPVNLNAAYADANEILNIKGSLYDSGTSLTDAIFRWGAANRIDTYAAAAGSTYVAPTSTSSTVPFTWGNSDYFTANGSYEAA